MRNRNIRRGLVAAIALIYIDVFTKQILPHATVHYVSASKAWAVMLAPIMILIAIAHSEFALAVGVLCAGALGNGFDTLDGQVSDPFVLMHRDGSYFAFNVADMCLALGSVLIMWELFRKIIHQAFAQDPSPAEE